MAQCQWQPNINSICKTFNKDVLNNCRSVESCNIVSRKRSKRNPTISFENKRWACCYSSSTVTFNKSESSSFVNENGWKVRRMIETEEEMRGVARVQAQAFHQPVLFFNDVLFEFFQAEVLSGLLYRLRNSPPDRYACLVAEPSNELKPHLLVGVVDATVFRDDDVLQYLPGAEEYLYVSGIAVLNKFRRQKVATALLKACDVLARVWGFEYLVLRAYEDDFGARQLYTNAGYRVVSSDPSWMTTWIGRRKRVLMVKQVSHESTFIH